MNTLLKRLLGIKGIDAWVITGPDDFLVVQNRPDMNCEFYIDQRGHVRNRADLKIFPCTITY